MDELKPCPFCGSRSTLRRNYTIGANNPGYIVQCIMCGISTPQTMSEEMSSYYWNTRPIEEKLRAENERLRAALAWYADEKHYLRGAPGEHTPREFIPPGWFCDVGERARKALKGGG